MTIIPITVFLFLSFDVIVDAVTSKFLSVFIVLYLGIFFGVTPKKYRYAYAYRSLYFDSVFSLSTRNEAIAFGLRRIASVAYGNRSVCSISFLYEYRLFLISRVFSSKRFFSIEYT